MPSSRKKQFPSEREIAGWLHDKPSDFWSVMRERNALDLFRRAARDIPAYRDFLKKEKIAPAKIKTFADFQNVPPVSKQNYLRAYPFSSLMWEGLDKKPHVFVSTSGSTGEPFYFPRSEQLEWEYSILADMFLEQSRIKGSTLVVVCFGMGVWIGGLFTYKAFEMAARRRGLPVSIITPGLGKQEIFNALKRLSPQFDETILVGYPPFIKDVIDEAPQYGVELKKINIRLLFAAEAFSERFRDHVAKRAFVKNPVLDTLNIYGTADIGAMAWETPTAILLRRAAMRKKALFKGIFPGTDKTPTLAQYNPLFMTFESPGGEILLTGDSAIPLIRYAIGDRGGTTSAADAFAIAQQNGIDIRKEAKHAGVRKISELPFVHVYERSDFSVVLSGANIYPEEIREVLQEKPLESDFTSKFTMTIRNDRKFSEYLEINLELKAGIRAADKIKKRAQELIVKNLLRRNSEYDAIHRGGVPHVFPEIVLWPHEDPLYFKPGIKQKWVKKN